MKTTARLVAIGVALLLGAPQARAGTMTAEVAEALRTLTPDTELPVIVTLPGGADAKAFSSEKDRRLRRSRLVRALKAHAAKAQAPLVAFLSQRGAKRVRPLWIGNRVALNARPDLIRALLARKDVASVALDATVSLGEPTSSTSASPEWNLGAIRAPELWSLGYAGEGVVVASMDTGVDALHADLAPRWRGGSNSWFDPASQHATPHDADGHGTQVMGVLLGGDAGGTSIGVAPMARWIAVKIYDDSGTGTLSNIHLGYQWLLDPDGDPDTDDAPDVVNNSWGLLNSVGECNAEFAPDLAALRAAGISVVFSAGNSGPNPGTSLSPANDPSSFAVGATNESSGVAGMSGRGPSACGGLLYPNVVAPGVNVWTTDLTLGVFLDSYVSVTGTSFAAPHVSGAVALLRSAFPSASADAIEGALAGTAVDLGPPGADMESGSGLIDVRAAYDLLASLGAPLASDDTYATVRDTPLPVGAPGVLGNDLEPQGEPMTAVLVRDVGAGVLALEPGGGFVYTPAAGFVGTDSFEYVASDGARASGPATVTLEVTAPPVVNHPPTAVDDAARARRNVRVTIAVLGNDRDVDGTLVPSSVTIVRRSAHGRAVARWNGTVAYASTGNFIGTDSFTYTVRDDRGAISRQATVTVTVEPRLRHAWRAPRSRR